jgi:hypothetical protein
VNVELQEQHIYQQGTHTSNYVLLVLRSDDVQSQSITCKKHGSIVLFSRDQTQTHEHIMVFVLVHTNKTTTRIVFSPSSIGHFGWVTNNESEYSCVICSFGVLPKSGKGGELGHNTTPPSPLL